MTSWMDNPDIADELSEKFPDWKQPGVTGVPVREYVAPVVGDTQEITGRESAYAHRALESQASDLARIGRDSGRNDFLNTSAFKMCQYVSSGWLVQNEVVTALLEACRINGLLAEDGEAQCLKTIYSGLRGGGRLSERDVEWHASDVPFTVVEGIEGYSAGTVPAGNQAQAPATNGHRNGTATDTARSIVWTSAANVADGVPDWGWHYEGKGRIQLGTLALFAGRPGAGKSTAARWLVAEATRGNLGGKFYGKPQNVIYIATEEPEQFTVVPSLRAANADLSRIHFPKAYAGDQQTIILSSLDEQNIGQYCLDNDIKILVVDALMTTVGGNTDINKNNEVRSMITPWQRIAEAIEGMVIGVVHLRKSTSGDVVAAINGSSAFGEVARSIFAFAKHPDTEQRIMSQHKNSTGFEDLSVFYELQTTSVIVSTGEVAEVARFVITGNADMTVEDVFTDAMANTGSTAEASMWLEDYLRLNGPHVWSKEAKQEGDKAGFSERTVKRAAQKVRVKSESRDFPRKTYWSLPEVSGATHSEPNRGLDD
jgi:AAA domain